MNFFAELEVQFERFFDAAHQGLFLDVVAVVNIVHFVDFHQKKIAVRKVFFDHASGLAFNQHLHRAVRQAQKLNNDADGSDMINIFFLRIVILGVLLRDHENTLFVFHRRLQCGNGFLTAHKQRNNHMRKHDNISQRQKRDDGRFFLFVFYLFIKHTFPLLHLSGFRFGFVN
ncbi:MAG: hypothetical protein BWX55_00917 [Deltaproteobacteria bacterium ADurb.Bin022]|nr:MAG: hypothetical protein BWX55_00917 [Deltaproteobacteria bacterium ADurb.Bin022]